MNKTIKIGVLLCAYGTPEYVEQCILPWVKARERHNLLISIVHGQFKEMHELGYPDNDKDTLNKLIDGKWEDYLYIQNNYYYKDKDKYIYQTEAELRNYPLQYLLKQNVDYVCLWDLDEVITDQEIDNLFEYLSRDENAPIANYRIEYKNLIFDSNHYITGFNPKRVWKVNLGDFKLNHIYYDNDFVYKHVVNDTFKLDNEVPHQQIPIDIINPLHYSWNDFKRSCQKINYQILRWGNCSFSINNEKESIEFSEIYYKNRSKPIVYELNS